MASLIWRYLHPRIRNMPLKIRIFFLISTTFASLYIMRLSFYHYFDRDNLVNGRVSFHHFKGSELGAVHPAQNGSLGFGKIFYISLPHRTDRQDSMTLLASSTNIELHLRPGVIRPLPLFVHIVDPIYFLWLTNSGYFEKIIGSTIHDKAKPNESNNLRPEQLGCWRSHADVWHRVIEEGTETALILEDDIDWDVNVHEVFQELSVQMRKGRLRTERASLHEVRTAPYGLDWDILYVGTCWDIPNTDNRPKHQTYNDVFGPNLAEMSKSFKDELEGWGVKVTNNTRKRVIAPSWYPVCTIGYAVTRLGAQKLLYNVGGVKGIGSGIDLTMSDRIQKGFLKSYTVVPPLVTPWKEGTLGDSDIDDLKEKEEKGDLEKGSQNLKNSARRALEDRLARPGKRRVS